MILLPLGFGRKIPRWPVMTICLIVFIFCISLQKMNDILTVSKTLTEHIDSELSHKKIAFEVISKNCTYFKLQNSECHDLAKFIDTAVSKKTKRSISSVDDESTANKIDFAKLIKIQQANALLLKIIAKPKKFVKYLTPESAQLVLSFKKSLNQKTQILTSQAHLFSDLNFNFISLTLSQFYHEGWEHLLGNLLIILFLGTLLEQRVRFWILPLLFMLGGYIGFLLEIYFSKNGYIVGASAGLMAFIGASYVFFFNEQMKFSMLIVKKNFYLPVKWIFPLIYFINDLGAAVSGVNDGVANYAHIGGAITGIIFALLYQELYPLEKGSVFLDDSEFIKKAIHDSTPIKQIEYCEKALEINANHTPARQLGLSLSVHHLKEHTDYEKFINEHLSSQISVLIREKKSELAFQLLDQLSLKDNIQKYISHTGFTNLNIMANYSLKKENWLVSCQIYDRILAQPKWIRHHANVIQNLKQIIPVVITNNHQREKLIQISSTFTKQFELLVQETIEISKGSIHVSN